MARGRTYSAISPLRLPCSIQIVEPHTRLPRNAHPWGPSQKSCGIQGIRRASSNVRVRQTVIQMEETKLERKEELRSADRRVCMTLSARRSLRGFVSKIGAK